MNDRLTNSQYEWDTLQSDIITLSTAQINQAIELSDPILNENQQWQAYLNALALSSFEQWLCDRAPELSLNKNQSSVFQPHYAGLIKAICNLKVGDFQICLLPVATVIDKTITLPRIVAELPEYRAHLYVIISIIEELEQASIVSFLPYSQLIEKIQASSLKVQSNWNYQIPMDWFNTNYDDLLLCLRCLEAEPIPYQKSVVTNSNLVSKVREKLERYQEQLQSSERELWQVFTWEEAKILFVHPEVFNQPQVNANSPVNVAVWLQDKLDEVARSLSWVLLPNFNIEQLNFATAMRSPVEELDDILTQLGRDGTVIPQQARGAFQNLTLGKTSLRLYAVTWAMLSPENVPEWQLLLVLGSPKGTSIPPGTRLQICDDTGILGELVRRQDIDPAYLYARVAGTWEESFFITISISTGETITLPPFTFYP